MVSHKTKRRKRLSNSELFINGSVINADNRLKSSFDLPICEKIEIWDIPKPTKDEAVSSIVSK